MSTWLVSQARAALFAYVQVALVKCGLREPLRWKRACCARAFDLTPPLRKPLNPILQQDGKVLMGIIITRYEIELAVWLCSTAQATNTMGSLYDAYMRHASRP